MRRSIGKSTLVAACAVLMALVGGQPQVRAFVCAYFVQFTDFDLVNGAVGIDYHEPTDSLVVSLNTPSGFPNNFDLVNAVSAAHTPFSALAGRPGEIKFATVRSSACQGGFTVGEMFAGNGFPGQLARISSDGATMQDPWVMLPGEIGYVTGVYQDRHCSFGGDLIVVTGDAANPTVGNVWRVTSAGVATLVVSLNTHLEGVVTLPNNPGLYGPIAGRILIGDEDRVPGSNPNGPNGRIFAVDPSGDVFTLGSGADPQYPSYQVHSFINYFAPFPINPEDLDIIPVPRPGITGDGDLFAIAAGDGKIVSAAMAAQSLSGCACGGILVTEQFPKPGTSGLNVLNWTGNEFQIEKVVPFNSSYTPGPNASWHDVAFKGGTDCRTCVGVIGDYVWKDLDGNGLQGPIEPGVAGVKVTLTRPGVPGYSQSVLTNASGHYIFTGLCLGSYVVTVTLPAGDTFTIASVGSDAAIDSNPNDAAVTLATDGDSNLTIDFGLKGPGTIGNFVWHDLNINGIQDSGEPGIAGVTLHLKPGYNSVAADIAVTVTDANGLYQFVNLNPGDYTVVINPPPGYNASPTNAGGATVDSNNSPSSTTLTLAQPTDQTIDFGYWQPPGRIIVKKVTVPATDTTTTFAFTTTGTGYNGFTLSGGGSNSSGDLRPGIYGVTESLPEGWTQTSATCDNGNAPGQIVLATNATVTCTFTNTKKAALGNFVWKDTNSNGVQNAGEPGVQGVTVQLFNGGLSPIASTTTDASGLYLFGNLNPGAYTVKFLLPSGYTFSPIDQGGNDALDSDANSVTGTTTSVTLAPGDINLTLDAGLVQATPPVCVQTTFTFTGNSAESGPAGNIRTFTSGGVSVKASAFSRARTGGTWATAYLGLYGPGLGVTDGSEGTGASPKHKVDNVGGRDNYVLFEFSSTVVVNQAFLTYLGADSDASIWIGTRTDPFNNHLTLGDALLGSLATEDNTAATTATSRWANVNASSVSGNVLIIATQVSDTTPEDEFKISKLDLSCAPPPPPPACVQTTLTFTGNTSTYGTAGNIRTFTSGGVSVKASAFSRTDSGGTWATAYLGLYGPGLGVTDGSEGTGPDPKHKVDNIGGRNNYVLFEFSAPIVVDRAFLDYLGTDSDASIWIGTKINPYTSHLTLGDVLLSSMSTEDNTTTSTTASRWADINAPARSGNVLVLATQVSSSPNDEFKLSKLDVCR